MGQGLTIPKEFHVPLSIYKEIASDTYTVKRTSGMLDEGWKISEESASEPALEGPSAAKYKVKDTEVWRIFMDNGKTAHEYVCGWRRVETIQPTRLNGDEEAINLWRQELIKMLEARN